MTNNFLLTDMASKYAWDKPVEFPKPDERPEIPVKQEPITPGMLPEPPEKIPAERPAPDLPTELPEPDKA